MSSTRLPAAFTLALALLMPGPALAAGRADVDQFGVVYQGDAGVNVVTFTDQPASPGQTQITIREPGISEISGSDADDCLDTGDQVVCTLGNAERLFASFDEGADVGSYDGGRIDHVLEGDGGGDRLTGSEATIGGAGSFLGESLRGGAGVDALFGRGGADELEAGPSGGDNLDGGLGNDTFLVGSADGAGDVLRGGPGFDLIDLQQYGAAAVDLAAASVSALDGSRRHTAESVEDVLGSQQGDRLLGTGGSNRLEGLGGNDEIDGNVGADVMDGGAGNDTVFARDGINDRVLGGLGVDTCALDQLDEHDGCETPLVGQVPVFGTPPPGDDRGPVCAVRGLSRTPARRAVLRGLRFRVFCDERGRISAQLLAVVGRLPRARAAARGDLVLATGGGRLGPARRRNVRLRVARGLRTAVRRGARLRLVMTATDRAGNRRTYLRRLRVR